ncbi:S24/S26 family peptidase [Bifidobacterium jacchi]|uniref:Peptidase S24/S26A/S26B/S26C domain-containing protein n=1 Tax=Bifidobacterium jacchi TaxID=2490545 RepID=A0A5N5RJC5_9BIFI|nr:S24/S26 family peptidase [Bifidobacterium jacchi]KAB5607395.1 hypothetical protein EHS19_04920 [Bifidobacterium jacchi]
MIARAASTGGDARRDAHDFASPSRPSASLSSAALSSIEQTLASEGVLVSTTSGRSMLPMLRNRRDTIVIRPAESARPGGLLRRFDVALYRRPDGAYVLHRVIRVVQTMPATQSAQSNHADFADFADSANRTDPKNRPTESMPARPDVTDSGSDFGCAADADRTDHTGRAAAAPAGAARESGVTYLIRGDNTFVLERVPADWVIGVLEECWRGNRHLDLSGWRYRAYCRIWNAIFPIRRIAHAMRGVLARTPLRTLVRAFRSLVR